MFLNFQQEQAVGVVNQIKDINMFLTTDDYKQLVTADDLDVVQQADATIREQAEKTAVEHVKGYLRGRYNVDAIFSATGENRNAELIEKMIDLVLYNLYSSQPGRMMTEIRVERKKDADKWLLDVQKGTSQPDFPTIDTDTETDIGNPIKFGGNKKVSSPW